jgi:hypothetical protein
MDPTSIALSDTWYTMYPFTSPKVFDITDPHFDVTRITNDMMRTGQPIVLRGFDRLHTWNEDLLSIQFLENTRGHDSKCRLLNTDDDRTVLSTNM